MKLHGAIKVSMYWYLGWLQCYQPRFNIKMLCHDHHLKMESLTPWQTSLFIEMKPQILTLSWCFSWPLSAVSCSGHYSWPCQACCQPHGHAPCGHGHGPASALAHSAHAPPHATCDEAAHRQSSERNSLHCKTEWKKNHLNKCHWENQFTHNQW